MTLLIETSAAAIRVAAGPSGVSIPPSALGGSLLAQRNWAEWDLEHPWEKKPRHPHAPDTDADEDRGPLSEREWKTLAAKHGLGRIRSSTYNNAAKEHFSEAKFGEHAGDQGALGRVARQHRRAFQKAKAEGRNHDAAVELAATHAYENAARRVGLATLPKITEDEKAKLAKANPDHLRNLANEGMKAVAKGVSAGLIKSDEAKAIRHELHQGIRELNADRHHEDVLSYGLKIVEVAAAITATLLTGGVAVPVLLAILAGTVPGLATETLHYAVGRREHARLVKEGKANPLPPAKERVKSVAKKARRTARRTTPLPHELPLATMVGAARVEPGSVHVRDWATWDAAHEANNRAMRMHSGFRAHPNDEGARSEAVAAHQYAASVIGRLHPDQHGQRAATLHAAAAEAIKEGSDAEAHGLSEEADKAFQRSRRYRADAEVVPSVPFDLELRDWKEWDLEHPWVHVARHRKWTDQDREVVAKARQAASHLPVGHAHTGPEPMTDAEYKAHRDHVEHELVAHGSGDLMRSPYSTINSQDRIGGVEGAYTEERKKLHDQILAEYDEKAKNVPSDRQAIIMAGLGGAGKSTALRHEAKSPLSVAAKLGIKYDTYDAKGNGVGDPSNFVTINPDDIKERMAELGAIPKIDELSDAEAAGVFAHEEASMLANRIAERMQSQGKNVIHDVTMTSVASGEKRLHALRMAGVATTKHLAPYHVSGVMVDASIDHALTAAEKRHRGGQDRLGKGIGHGGRYVPSDLILAAKDPQGIYSSLNRRAFETLKQQGRFDHTLTIDNENFAQRLVSETGHRNATSLFSALILRATTEITAEIEAYRRGQMSLDDLIDSLANREYATPSYMTWPDQTLSDAENVDWAEPGTWGEVQQANDSGLLTDDEYGQIHAATMAAHTIPQHRDWKEWDEAHKVEDYHGQHEAPGPEYGDPMHDIGSNVMPKDYVDHPEWYGSGDKKSDDESFAAMRKARNNPDATIRIYRALPKGHTHIHAGDWVTPSKSYAEGHAASGWAGGEGQGHVIHMDVPAKELWTNGDSPNEWGWHPTKRVVVGEIDTRNWKEWDEEHPWIKKGRQHHFGSYIESLFGKGGKHSKKYQPPKKTPEQLAAEKKAKEEAAARAKAEFDRRKVLAGKFADIDPHSPEGGGWAPRDFKSRYGGVIFDNQGRVLLREPLNHYDGYAWTFSKGHPDSKDEHPTQTAIRETEEETGLHPRIIGTVPEGYGGTYSRNHFYLMEDSGQGFHPEMMNGETQSLVWATPAQADLMMQRGTNEQGVYRDRQILRAAVAAHEKATGIHNITLAPLPPPPKPPPPPPKPPKVIGPSSAAPQLPFPKSSPISQAQAKKNAENQPPKKKPLGLWYPGMPLPGERAVVELELRNWAQWHLEHPYIHHPRVKHGEGYIEPEHVHHVHAPTVMPSAKELPIPKEPKGDADLDALKAQWLQEAQNIHKFKAGSTRAKRFEAGYVTARADAWKKNLSSEDAHTLSEQHNNIAEGLQPNQAQAKREGVAAGYHAHSIGFGATHPPGKVTLDAPYPNIKTKAEDVKVGDTIIWMGAPYRVKGAQHVGNNVMLETEDSYHVSGNHMFPKGEEIPVSIQKPEESPLAVSGEATPDLVPKTTQIAQNLKPGDHITLPSGTKLTVNSATETATGVLVQATDQHGDSAAYGFKKNEAVGIEPQVEPSATSLANKNPYLVGSPKWNAYNDAYKHESDWIKTNNFDKADATSYMDSYTKAAANAGPNEKTGDGTPKRAWSLGAAQAYQDHIDSLPEKPVLEAGEVSAAAGKPVVPPIGHLGPQKVPLNEHSLNTFKKVSPGDTFSNGEKVPNTGTNGGQWYDDGNGNAYLLKPWTSDAHSYNEVAGSLAYQQAGIPVQHVTLVHMDNGHVQALSHYIKGLTPITSPKDTNDTTRSTSRAGYGMDALMSHYDLAGLTNAQGQVDGPNLFKNSAGQVTRLDLGGSGRFRAQGAPKPGWKTGAFGSEDNPDYESIRLGNQGKLAYGVTKPGLENLPEDMNQSLAHAADFNTLQYHQAMLDAGISKQFADSQVAVIQSRQNQLHEMGFGQKAPIGVVAPSVEMGTPETYEGGHSAGLQTGQNMEDAGKNAADIHHQADILPPSTDFMKGMIDGLHEHAQNMGPPAVETSVATPTFHSTAYMTHGAQYDAEHAKLIEQQEQDYLLGRNNGKDKADLIVSPQGAAAQAIKEHNLAVDAGTPGLGGEMADKNKAYHYGMADALGEKAVQGGVNVGFPIGGAKTPEAAKAIVGIQQKAADGKFGNYKIAASKLEFGDRVQFPGHEGTYTVTGVSKTGAFNVSAVNEATGVPLTIGGASLKSGDLVQLISHAPTAGKITKTAAELLPGDTFDFNGTHVVDHVTDSAAGMKLVYTKGDSAPFTFESTDQFDVRPFILPPPPPKKNTVKVEDLKVGDVVEHPSMGGVGKNVPVEVVGVTPSPSGNTQFVTTKQLEKNTAGQPGKVEDHIIANGSILTKAEKEITPAVVPTGADPHVVTTWSNPPGNLIWKKYDDGTIHAFNEDGTEHPIGSDQAEIEKNLNNPTGTWVKEAGDTHPFGSFAHTQTTAGPRPVAEWTSEGIDMKYVENSDGTVDTVSSSGQVTTHMVGKAAQQTKDNLAGGGVWDKHTVAAAPPPAPSGINVFGYHLSHDDAVKLDQALDKESSFGIQATADNAGVKADLAPGQEGMFMNNAWEEAQKAGTESNSSKVFHAELKKQLAAAGVPTTPTEHIPPGGVKWQMPGHPEYGYWVEQPDGSFDGYDDQGKLVIHQPASAGQKQSLTSDHWEKEQPAGAPAPAGPKFPTWQSNSTGGTWTQNPDGKWDYTPGRGSTQAAKVNQIKSANFADKLDSSQAWTKVPTGPPPPEEPFVEQPPPKIPSLPQVPSGENKGFKYQDTWAANYAIVKKALIEGDKSPADIQKLIDQQKATYEGKAEADLPWSAKNGAAQGIADGSQQALDDFNKGAMKVSNPVLGKQKNHNAAMSTKALVTYPNYWGYGSSAGVSTAAKTLLPGNLVTVMPTKDTSSYNPPKHIVLGIVTNKKNPALVDITTQESNGTVHKYTVNKDANVKATAGVGQDAIKGAPTAAPTTVYTSSVKASPKATAAHQKAMEEAGKALAPVLTPPPEDFQSAFAAAYHLKNWGVKEKVPQKIKASDEELQAMPAYKVAFRSASQHGKELSDQEVADAEQQALDLRDRALSPSAAAAALGTAHGYAESHAPVEKEEATTGEHNVPLEQMPEYHESLNAAEAMKNAGATSKDLYAQAGQYSQKGGTANDARAAAFQNMAEQVDAAENPVPQPDIHEGNPPMTEAQVAEMTKKASEGKGLPMANPDALHLWAYDQGRAQGLMIGNIAKSGGLTAADIEAGAQSEEALARSTVGLQSAKHWGAARMLHRVALNIHNGDTSDITTNADVLSPKPDVQYHPPGTPQAAGTVLYGKATKEAEWTADEKTAFSWFTGPYRFSSAGAKPHAGAGASTGSYAADDFYAALNTILADDPAMQPAPPDPVNKNASYYAYLFLNACNTKSVPSQMRIYRGTEGHEFAPGDFQKIEAAVNAGQTVQFSLPISSMTYNPKVSIYNNRPVHYFIDQGALTMDGTFGTGEYETNTGGLMEIYKIQHMGSKTVIYMRQVVHYAQ